MEKLTHESLFSLEQYARARPEFRAKVIAHKKVRLDFIVARVLDQIGIPNALVRRWGAEEE